MKFRIFSTLLVLAVLAGVFVATNDTPQPQLKSTSSNSDQEFKTLKIN